MLWNRNWVQNERNNNWQPTVNWFNFFTGSQLSVEPTFHWVIYVPHATQLPMQIYVDSKPVPTNSVLSPRWNGGGLYVLNGPLDVKSCSELIIAQLRKALGFQNKVFIFHFESVIFCGYLQNLNLNKIKRPIYSSWKLTYSILIMTHRVFTNGNWNI